MNTLKNGRFVERMAAPDEIKVVVKELKDMVKKYNWGNRRIAPNGFYIAVDEFLNRYDNIERFSSSSRSLAISEINGFIKICVDPWEKLELEPKVKVELPGGKVKDIPKSLVEDFIELGATVIV